MLEEMTPDQFLGLVKKTNSEKPALQDVNRLRQALVSHPEFLDLVGSLALQSQQALLSNAKMTAASKEIVFADLNRIRAWLGYDQAPMLEKLLIEQVCGCYLRLYFWESLYHANSSCMRLETAIQWEQVIAMAQRRYMRAIEVLSRVRRVGIHLQVNIAGDGGQQVNLSGGIPQK